MVRRIRRIILIFLVILLCLTPSLFVVKSYSLGAITASTALNVSMLKLGNNPVNVMLINDYAIFIKREITIYNIPVVGKYLWNRWYGKSSKLRKYLKETA